MVVAWRLVKPVHAAAAFDGEGSARFGGRWNSTGVRVVYASSSLSLAVLEMLVHLSPLAPAGLKAFRIVFDPSCVEALPPESLPLNWRLEPPAKSTQALGDAWVRSGRSPVLAAPSVIVPEETNFLLNPMHARFQELKRNPPVDYALDPRLLAPRRAS